MSIDIRIGDCREVLPTLPAQSVHTVITSPPYWGLRDYGVAGQIGLEDSLFEFYQVMKKVFTKVWQVLRNDGTLWINMGDTYRDGEMLGVPWGLIEAIRSVKFCPKCDAPGGSLYLDRKNPDRVILTCPECGHQGKRFNHWRLRSDIIWHKPNPVPEPDRGRPTVAHEYLFLLSKHPDYFYDNDAIREPVGDEPDWESYEAGLGSNIGCDSHRWTKGYKKVSHKLKHPNGSQKRSVWTIPIKGFPGAHFATFPPALVEPCILAGTSEHGCCASCGAPWKRITEVTEEYKARLGQSWNDHQDDLVKGQRGIPSSFRGAPARTTKGWAPTCECNADVVPCTVLDPFNGAGTTGLVARRLFRKYVGIELNPDYAALAMARIEQDMPLFNALSDSQHT